MLMSDNMWLLVILSVVLIVSFVSSVITYICFSRLRKQALLTTELYRQLEHNLKLLSSSTIGMGKKIVALEKELPEVHSQVDLDDESHCQPNPAKSAVTDTNMNDAIMLLNAGVEPEEVARRCGISKAEVSLMKLMHTQTDSVSAA